MKKFNETIFKQLNQRPIAYYPAYKQLTKSVAATVLLSQLMYWFSKKNIFYKTNREIMEETGLSEYELKSGKAAIKKLDFVTVKVKGLPAKTYYEIDWELYEKALSKLGEIRPTSQTNVLPTSQTDVLPTSQTDVLPTCQTNVLPTITKTTTKTTTKNKNNTKVLQKKIKSFKNLSYDEFVLEVKECTEYSEHFETFINYWTEKDDKGKMKFQFNKTWETKRRLATWAKNNYNSNFKSTAMTEEEMMWKNAK